MKCNIPWRLHEVPLVLHCLAGQDQIADHYTRQWHAVQSMARGTHPCQMLTPRSGKKSVQTGGKLRRLACHEADSLQQCRRKLIATLIVHKYSKIAANNGKCRHTLKAKSPDPPVLYILVCHTSMGLSVTTLAIGCRHRRSCTSCKQNETSHGVC